MNSFQLSSSHPYTTISEFRLFNQLEIGDSIQIDTLVNNGWYPKNSFTEDLPYFRATIVGFNSPDDPYPVKVNYNNRERPYSIPLRWIEISDVILRDIKINRILNKL